MSTLLSQAEHQLLRPGGLSTSDLDGVFARLMDGATQVSCSGFGQVMIDNM